MLNGQPESAEELAALRAGVSSYPDRLQQRWGPFYRENGPFDWTGCISVEVVPGKVSGTPILVHSRMPADSVLNLFENGLTPEEIAEDYEQDLQSVREVLIFAGVLERERLSA